MAAELGRGWGLRARKLLPGEGEGSHARQMTP